MFDVLTDSFKSAVSKLRFSDDTKALKNALDFLKKALLKADVHHKLVKELLISVEQDTIKLGVGQRHFLQAIKDNLTKILTVPGNQGFVFAPKSPTVVLMIGLQGSGKTTTTIKLATYLKLRKKKVLVVAADLQRLAAVEQLKQLCSQNDIDLYSDENEKSPVDISKKAMKVAQSGMYDVVLVDTAGRLAINEELMDELFKIKQAINPHEQFYVVDSMSGQDAVKTAQFFHDKIGITGVILSKYDGDSKGGIALGIASQVGVPLRFIGIGEKPVDLEGFLPDRVVSRLMGEGDLATLAEKTSMVIDDAEAKKMTKKIKKGEFNFNDFLSQMESMKKLGSLKSVIGMIPGLSNVAGAIKDIDFDNSKEINNMKAMISSMTPKEKEQPSLLNNARKRRIALGAGVSQMEVNRFLKQFENAAKVAKRFSGKNGAQSLQNMLSGQKNFPR